MKQQKYYQFLQQQILLMIGLSLIPGAVYMALGWVFDVFFLASLWYGFLVLCSVYGWFVYREFSLHNMSDEELVVWYRKFTWFMYVMFASWLVIFLIFVSNSGDGVKYIAVFTQIGASVVAAVLLVSDKKLFIPVLFMLMLPLAGYFLFVGTWYGYTLSVFSLILMSVLFYAAYNTHRLIQKNYYHARHDALTGLHNRRFLMEFVDSFKQRLRENDQIAYIFLIDLDHFKSVNDSLGHDVGDKLLQEVASRIKSFVDKRCMVSRLGGDEFMLISKAFSKNEFEDISGEAFATQILEVIRAPYLINEHHLHISASIGVHRLAPDSFLGGNFIQEVDIAMYEAKAQGRDGVIVFNKALEEKVKRYLHIEQKLHLAIKQKDLKIYFQPQFDKNEQLVGGEALVRWTDDELGVLGPQEFIPIAEKTGLILDLGRYVLQEVLQVVKEWNKEVKKIDSVSINISIRQLITDSFVDEVRNVMHHCLATCERCPRIIFEITEHVFAHDIKKVVYIMNELKKDGITFSVDDFGTGYSALSYLGVLPIDEVKIDKSFIDQMNEGTANKKMINTIVAIAKNYDLRIVAEGVETFEQLAILSQNECDVYQGYYFDKALPVREFEEKYIFKNA